MGAQGECGEGGGAAGAGTEGKRDGGKEGGGEDLTRMEVGKGEAKEARFFPPLSRKVCGVASFVRQQCLLRGGGDASKMSAC